MKEYHVGIYARLSRDDERQGESVSIENQKLLLRRYCDRQGWTVVGEYVDDGWSGTNFDRPAFRRLLEDVEQKKVNLVLVKDLSRLGRDYIEVGKYTDCVFPYYGCRFVAVNDGVDTLRQNDDVAMIFKNVINDIYARDTSKKIRAVRRANAESGKFMGYKAPYGYLRSAEDKHRLAIDPPAAEVVRRIFALRQSGLSVQAVADELNRSHVLPPREYALAAAGKSWTPERTWSRETVRSILGNEAYIGNLVQLKQSSLSYKDHRHRPNPPELWARAEHTHPTIVDQETWQAVRELEQRDYHPRRRKEPSALDGLLYCTVCGAPLRRAVNRKQHSGGEKTYVYYFCRGHVFAAEETLRQIIQGEVKAALAALDAVEFEEKLRKRRQADGKSIYRTELTAVEKRLAELDGQLRRLYEDYTAQRVAPPVYRRLMEQYEKELKGQEERHSRLLQQAAAKGPEGKAVEELLTEPVPQRLLAALARRIEVGPKTEGAQKICIYYKYNGAVSL